MKKYILLVILLTNLNGFSQDLNDLLNRLKTENDREKIETYLDISELNIPKDTSIIYLNKALELAHTIHFDSIYPIQFNISISYYLNGNIQKAKSEIKKGFQTYKFTSNPKAFLGQTNMLLGVYSETENKIDSAKYYYNKVLHILQNDTTVKAKSVLSSTYTNYANLYLKQGRYEKAIGIYIKALKLYETESNEKAIIYNNLAVSYKELKNYDKTLYYFNEALKISKKTNNNRSIGGIYLGIGQTYLELKQNDKALKNFLDAEKILYNSDKLALPIAYQNLAEIYLSNNDLSKAEYYSTKAFNSYKVIPDNFTKVSILVTQAEILTLKKEYNKALKRINEAFELAQKNNYLNLQRKIIKLKIKNLKQTNNTADLPKLYDKYISLNDSINSTENLRIITDTEAKYQNEKKEKENLQLKAEKAEQTIALEKENKRKWLLASGFIASLISLGIFAFYYRKNNYQKKIIENLQKDLHHRVKNNLSIIDSLVDEIKDEFDNEKFNAKLTDLQNRIASINEVHKQLYQGQNLTQLNLKKYVEMLAKNVQSSFNNPYVKINNSIDESLIIETEKSFPIGLIINEFITNSFKHAFSNGFEGIININLIEKQKNYILSLSDNGKGLPNNLDISKLNSFGMDVMQLLSKQLGGKFHLNNKNGVILDIEFPK